MATKSSSNSTKAATKKAVAKAKPTAVGTKAGPAVKKVAMAKAAPPAKKVTVAKKVVAAKSPPAKKSSKVAKSGGSAEDQRRIYVLDTNVLLHDPYSPIKFKEHDVYIPLVTIEELDNKKAGTSDVNRNAREATRLIEDITTQAEGSFAVGYPLEAFSGHKDGRLLLQQEYIGYLQNDTVKKNDNLYLGVMEHLIARYPERKVVMVTKDLNLRVKARALGFNVEDYRHDHSVDDAKLFFRGIHEMNSEWLSSHGGDMKVSTEKGISFYELPALPDANVNEFVYIKDTDSLFTIIGVSNGRMMLEEVSKQISAYGIRPRNEEQRAALSLLLDPEVDLVALLGPAGTGKTLLALAAGVEQVLVGQSPMFDEILFTRATVALGEDIGFLPGNEEEKMMPWLGALQDNVEVLAESAPRRNTSTASDFKAFQEKLQEYIRPRAITFMRGRTFQRKLLIIDEAQNLTPKQVKALITRAGNGTKVICMGNLAQIDSPYLSEQSSGLAYAVKRFKGWKHFGSLILQQGERSRLANEGNTRL